MRKSVHMASFQRAAKAFPAPLAFDTGNKVAAPEDLSQRSSDSAEMNLYWRKVRDVSGGIDTMRAAGKTYMPFYPGEDKETFEFRLSLAKLTNIYSDTVSNLASKPFEQEITFPIGEEQTFSDLLPPEIVSFIENVDGAGNNLTKFSSVVFQNGINYVLDWIMINFPRPTPIEGRNRTVADDKAEGIRPFWSRVPAANVYEVRTEIHGGNERFTYIRIHEPAENGSNDRYRVFELIDKVVRMTIFEKTAKGFETVEGTPVDLTIDQIPMVPFITGQRDGKRWFFEPPLRSALELQLVLYRKESGLEFADTMTAYPMLAMIGVKAEKGPDGKPMPLQVGPSRTLWLAPDGAGNHGDVKYIEPSATSLTHLREGIKETKQDLRELGKQPLTAQSGNLTVITTAVAAGKTRSAVAAWGLTLKDAIENALVITCKYFNIALETYDPEVNIYDGYDDFSDAGQEVSALQTARAARDISQDTYWSELKRRGILSAEFDPAAEKLRLLKEIPADGLPGEEDDDENGNPQNKGNPK